MPAAGFPGLMAGYLAKTTAILVLALIAAALSRRRPAAFRHFVLSSALVGLLLLPLLDLGPLGWPSPFVPSWMAPASPRPTAAMGPGPGRSAKPSAAHAITLAADANDEARLEVPGGESVGFPATLSVELAASGRTASGTGKIASGPPSSRRAGPASGPEAGGAGTPGLVLAAAWVIGLLALLARLASGLAGASRLTSQGTPLEGPGWRALVDRFLALFRLRRPVRLETHPAVLVPLTWGWRKPVVLFPEGADDWSDDERASALYHELSHIQRADFLIMLLVRTSLAVFWWNPLCWVVYRDLRKEQEIACDELVLRAGIRPSTYAASLLAFRRSAGFRWNPSAALLGLLGRSSFQDRLAAILKHKMTLMEVKMKTKIMVALTLAGAVALIGTARPAAGRDASAPRTVLAETAVPQAPVFEPAGPGADPAGAGQAVASAQEKEKAVAAEKAKQAEKAEKAKVEEKAAKEKTRTVQTIVIKGGEDEEPVEVVITQGDRVKTLKLEKPLTITKGKDGDTLVLSIDGKDVEILKGEPLRLEIKGRPVEILRRGRPAEAGEEGVYRLRKDGATIVIGEPGQTLVFTPRKHRAGFALGKGGEEGPAEVIVEGRADVRSDLGWTIRERGKDDGVWVSREVEGRPFKMAWADGGKGWAFSSATDKEMLDKVHALQEQVQAIKAKKMDLAALEESLKKLEAELAAKEDKLKALELKLEDMPEKFAVIEKMRADKERGRVAYVIKEKHAAGEAAAAESAARIKVIAGDKDDGMITLVFGEKGLDKAAYERALTTLKKALPEGYTIEESDLEEDGPSMTFKIAPPKGQAFDKALIKKLIELVEPEIAKK